MPEKMSSLLFPASWLTVSHAGIKEDRKKDLSLIFSDGVGESGGGFYDKRV